MVGLDIGYSMMRAAQVSYSKQGVPTIEKLHEVLLPTEILQYGEIRNPEAFSEYLKTFWKEGDFKTNEVTIAAGDMHVFARELTVPQMSMQRIRESLPFLMESVLPVSPELLYFDFYPSEDTVVEGAASIRGLVVAAEKSNVDLLVNCVIGAHLRVATVDFGPFALLRVRLDPKLGSGVNAIVDVGSVATRVVITRGLTPLFVRVIPTGGQNYDEALMAALRMSELSAADTKRRLKEPPTDEIDLAAWTVLQNSIQEFVVSLKSTLDYFEQAHAGEGMKIEQIMMSGGGSHLSGMLEAVEKVVSIPIIQNGDMSHFQKSSDIDASNEQLQRMALAIGLAMGAESK
jgi:type IV pilus assembly protein PilM